MADNENQWEDTEYSETENEEYTDYDDQSEYSDDEYGEYEDEDGVEYTDDYEQQHATRPKSGCAPLIVLLIFLILIGGIGYGIYDTFFGKKTIMNAITGNKTSQNAVQNANQQQQNNGQPAPNEGEMGDYFFNEAGGNEGEMMSVDFNADGNNQNTQNQPQNNEGQQDMNIANANLEQGLEIPNLPQQNPDGNNQNNNGQQPALPSEEEMSVDGLLDQNLQQNDNSIMISYAKPSRENPFKPLVDIISGDNNFALFGDEEYEILEPPVASTPDENLTKLLQTQISGILYDEESPSAIVNLNGADQFVKVGDEISGYTIDSITKDKVQISYKDNSYVASVGQLFTRGSLEKQPAVVNLENKFAGRYRNN